AESLDQTRGWFYTLVVLSAALFKNTSFKNVVCTGLVLAEDGKKMSKRLKNYPEVNQIFDSYGADALRIYLMNSALVKAEEMNFSERGVKEVTRMLQLPLWNSYSFFVTYANIDNWDPQKDMMGFDKINNPLDKWILSSTEKLVDEVTRQMDSYDLQRAIRPFLLFIDQLTNWYIRRSRRRFWKSDMDDEKKGAYSTLYRVLIRLVKVMAPFTPFIADAIYLGLRTEEQPESVHLCDYPVSEEKMRDNDLEREMDLAMRTVSMGRALRGQHKIRVRQPLSEIHLITTDVKEKAVLKKLDTLVREELNVKQVIFNEKEEDLVTLSAKANYKELGSRLGKNMKTAAGLISAFTMDDIKTLQNGKSINIKDGDFSEDIGFKDILIDRKERDGLFVINDNTLTVALNAELNDELIQEGLAREIVHHVQNMRKSAGFEVTDRIKLGIGGDNRIGEVMDLFSDYIKNEVLAVDIVKIPEGESVSLEGVEGIFSVEKVS
ncbi:MAG: class I tRNA ligase family protein, partial [Spirochaetes bacterium]|nr:class I tRNA ligase family protein [Spirochaetota bacterium]